MSRWTHLLAKEINQTHPQPHSHRSASKPWMRKGYNKNNLASIHDTLLSSQGPNTPQHPPHTHNREPPCDLVQGRATTLHHPAVSRKPDHNQPGTTHHHTKQPVEPPRPDNNPHAAAGEPDSQPLSRATRPGNEEEQYTHPSPGLSLIHISEPTRRS